MDLNIFPLFICKIPNNYSFQRTFDFSFEIDLSLNTTQFVEREKKKDKELRKNESQSTKLGKKMLNCVNIIKSYVPDL